MKIFFSLDVVWTCGLLSIGSRTSKNSFGVCKTNSDSVSEYFSSIFFVFILFMLSSAFTINCIWVWDCIWLDPHCNVDCWRFSHFHTSLLLFLLFYSQCTLLSLSLHVLLYSWEKRMAINWPLSTKQANKRNDRRRERGKISEKRGITLKVHLRYARMIREKFLMY